MRRYVKIWIRFAIGMLFALSLGKTHLMGWQEMIPNRIHSVDTRHFDSIQLKVFSAQPDFDYRIKPQRLSYFQRLLQWLSQKFDKGGKNSSAFWKYVGIGLAVMAISLLIFQLAKIPAQGIWARKVSSLEGPEGVLSQEDVSAIAFDERITQALSQGNFRKALRLLFLESLSLLSASEAIDWKAYKTNQEYELELQGGPYADTFRKLRLTFEYVWYGDFPLDKERYEETARIFSEFREQMERKVSSP